MSSCNSSWISPARDSTSFSVQAHRLLQHIGLMCWYSFSIQKFNWGFKKKKKGTLSLSRDYSDTKAHLDSLWLRLWISPKLQHSNNRYLYNHDHWDTIHDRQAMESNQVSISMWMEKDNVWFLWSFLFLLKGSMKLHNLQENGWNWRSSK